MKRLTQLLLMMCFVVIAHADTLRHGPMLYCHRTANKDWPENTLNSLEQAALLGCDVVEIDLRKTLDGQIVLNHDGVLERLTDGYGNVEDTNFAELELLDAGSWMAPRFSGLHIARFDDALRLARSLDIRLILDIKTKGIGPDVLRILEREGMMDRVDFGGEWDDIRRLLPNTTDTESGTVWVQPGVAISEVADLHRRGKAVIANFSANSHEMDLESMKAAVAAGVDGINVDYPRLGADAVGRPVEARIHALAEKAQISNDADRVNAILALSRYQEPATQEDFLRWLDSPLPKSSHAAALALLLGRPQVKPDQLSNALQSKNACTRANAAWLVGMLHADSKTIAPLLSDSDQSVQIEALRSLARTRGTVPKDSILAFFQSSNAVLRGAAAQAFAHAYPEGSAQVIAAQLKKEIENERALAKQYVDGGRKDITPEQIAKATSSFRGQMAMVHALSSLGSTDATEALAHVTFEPTHEFAQSNPLVGCFQLWDRLGDDPAPAVQQLSSSNVTMANCAEWALVKAGPRVAPSVRAALNSSEAALRAIHILGWQGDAAALPQLEKIAHTNGPLHEQAAWAIEKIRLLRSLTN